MQRPLELQGSRQLCRQPVFGVKGIPSRSHNKRCHCSHQQSRPKQRHLTLCQASKTFYEVLDVPKTADSKTIKKAFKKAALKYHPDVNKEPDAKDKFMACKTAYQTLVDDSQRRQYDRTIERGSGGIDWDSIGDAFRKTSGQASRKPKQEEEEFYGFGDFFRDLDKDFEERQSEGTAQPKSLWQEVYDIGEEFVEFLEQEIGAKQRKTSKNSSTQPKSEAAQNKEISVEERARRAEKEELEKKLQAEKEIEDMLAELRGKVKKDGSG